MLPAGDRSLTAVLGDLVTNVQHLLRAEVRLARTEIVEDAQRMKSVAGLMAAAGVLAVLALGFFLLSAMYGLALFMPLWGAAIVVAVLALAVAASCGLSAQARLKRIRGLPKTTQSLKENFTWSKQPGA